MDVPGGQPGYPAKHDPGRGTGACRHCISCRSQTIRAYRIAEQTAPINCCNLNLMVGFLYIYICPPLYHVLFVVYISSLVSAVYSTQAFRVHGLWTVAHTCSQLLYLDQGWRRECFAKKIACFIVAHDPEPGQDSGAT